MTRQKGVVISLLDYTGNMIEPWARAGFTCYCVDIQHPPGESKVGNIVRIGADIREWLPPFAKLKMFFAFPPCTHVAVSGARWFQDKGIGSLIDLLQLFEAAVRIAEWTRAPYMIENPVSTISSYWRKPDYVLTHATTEAICNQRAMLKPRKLVFGLEKTFGCQNPNECFREKEAECTV